MTLKFLVPEAWRVVPLLSAAEVVMGQSPAGTYVNQEGEGVPFFQGKAEFGELHPTPKKFCTQPKKMALPGDVLLSVRAPVGPTNVANQEVCIGRGLSAVRGSFGVDEKYLLHYFRNIEPWMGQQGTGSTFKAVSGGFIKELPFPLPPLAEQNAIADKLDELLAQVSNLKGRLDAIPAILKRFRQSVLVAAYTGILTSEFQREFREVDEFLSDVEKLRKVRWDEEADRVGRKRRYKTPVTGDISLLREIPKEWRWASVDSLSSKVVDGVHKKPNYTECGVPFLTVKNLTAGKGISFESVKYVSEADHEEFYKRANPESGDILITKDGTLGVVRRICSEVEFSIFVSLALVKPVKKSMAHYLELAFKSPILQAQMVGVGSGLQHIHLTDLRKDMVPIAPEDEQKEIVRRVDQLFAFADQVEQQVNNAQARVNKLTHSILAKAFRGELTAEWRAANPELISGENSAEALLEWIKAEKANQKPASKRRGRKVAVETTAP